jgi:hypothetical protein
LQLNAIIMVYHKDIIQNVTPLPSIPKAYLFKALQIIKANSHDGSVKKITSIARQKINHYIPHKNQSLLRFFSMWFSNTCPRQQNDLTAYHSPTVTSLQGMFTPHIHSAFTVQVPSV